MRTDSVCFNVPTHPKTALSHLEISKIAHLNKFQPSKLASKKDKTMIFTVKHSCFD